MRITLLGPQRRATGARDAVAELVPDGPVAAVNAGWLEREADTGELDLVLGGRLVNLELHRRWLELREADRELEEGEQRLAQRQAELRTAYRLRLVQALAAVRAVAQRVQDERVRTEAYDDALRAVRGLDEWYLQRGREARLEVAADLRLEERDSLRLHRDEVAGALAGSAGLVVAGGHVGVLLHLLRLFGVADLIMNRMITVPVITWSAGAMALSERVVLFHDHPPYGERPPEVHAEGLGAYAGIVVFPHAKRRLRLADHDHVGMLARRFAPRTCVVLNDGARLDLVEESSLPEQVPRLTAAGYQVSGFSVGGERER